MSTEMPQTPPPGAPAPSEAPSGGAPRPAYGGPRGPRPGGDRDRDRDRGERRGFGGGPGGRRPRRKVCVFCVDKVKRIDYKDKPRLQRYLSDRARIEPRRKTGTCAKHQRMLTTALKRARFMALLPYTADHVRGMMSARDRAIAGGPPPERPPRPPYRPYPPRTEGPLPPRPASPGPAAPPPGPPAGEAPKTEGPSASS